MNKKRIIYLITIICALLYIILGNRLISKNVNKVAAMDEPYVRAKVEKIVSITKEPSLAGLSEKDIDITVNFKAKIITGEHKDKIIQTEQLITYPNSENAVELKKGDKILVINVGETSEGIVWKYVDRERISPVIILGIVFLILLILFGKTKGLNTLLALAFTICSIFLVFIPSILAGYNIYVGCITTCTFIVITTVIIVYGIDKKSIATTLGCFGRYINIANSSSCNG